MFDFDKMHFMFSQCAEPGCYDSNAEDCDIPAD